MAEPRCQCDGRYKGCQHGRNECEGKPGTPWSTWCCLPCDERRLAHIDRNLSQALESLRGANG